MKAESEALRTGWACTKQEKHLGDPAQGHGRQPCTSCACEPEPQRDFFTGEWVSASDGEPLSGAAGGRLPVGTDTPIGSCLALEPVTSHQSHRDVLFWASPIPRPPTRGPASERGFCLTGDSVGF